MKKVILVSAISALFSVSALASQVNGVGPTPDDTDSTSATLTWKADVPIIIPGSWITFTGRGGSMTLQDGDLNVKPDGSFNSTVINLELHTWDEETKTAGELIKVGEDQFDGIAVDTLAYQVKTPTFKSELGTDVSSVQTAISMNESVIEPGASVDSTETQTRWKIGGAGIGTMIGGDSITAQTVVMADVTFAEVGGV
ncbi:conserved exported hypothetical protein [Vibrio owensii]|uniref:hypothetical protein n=1 Tax=Vibrio owensii TaxID=696485 RepID=UPI00289504C2|nr:conserved exported hypothetical protein [Vibrio owensii]CAH1586452.1 conserved exported hypothetical protein [Vibrio owensii]